ncbi:MAG: prepilin-type N-terminal cleavage/methylation domain-containing protein [Bdellovibrionota bacterium]
MLLGLGKRSTLRDNRGFSLVELMVVVAIIGVLAAIAVPNVTRYIAKSRQSEAKTNLAGLYSANQAFFAEYNTYTNAFEPMGYRPTGQLRYSAGFIGTVMHTAANLQTMGYPATGAAPAFVQTGFAGTAAYCVVAPTAIPALPAGQCQMLAESRTAAASPAPFAIAMAAVPTNVFRAGAAALIVTGSGLIDTWTIDQSKTVTNSVTGVL